MEHEHDTPEDVRGVWPMVLGIVCIVFSLLGVLTGAWNAYTTLLNPSMSTMGFQTDAGKQAAQAVMQKYALITGPMAVVGVLLAGLLGVAGIVLIRRHRDAPGLVRFWAITKIVVSVVGWGAAVMLFRDLEPVMREHIQQGAGVAIGVQRVFAVVGFLWSLALPVFLLLWLRRSSVRAQTRAWD